jgi:hypothetical protein
MAYPTPVVEIAFDDGPYVVSPTWTDVTAYVRGLSTSRGVPDDWTLTADGSASVTLSNRDRRFDPFYTSGPYYGKLLPRRQIRIRTTYSGTTYDVFRGFIAGWPPQWTDAGYDSTVTLSCFDALQLLGSSSVPDAWSDPYTASLSPRHWWKFNEPLTPFTGTAVFKDYGSAPYDLTSNAGAYSNDSLALGQNQKSVGSNGNVIGVGSFGLGTGIQFNTLNTASSVSVVAFIKSTIADANSPSIDMAVGGFASVNVYQTSLAGADYGRIYGRVFTATTRYTFQTSLEYDVGQPYHVAFTFNRNTNAGAIYVDGVLDSSGVSAAVVTAVPTYEYLNIVYGDVQQVSIFDKVLTQDEVRNILNLSNAQFKETTSARVSRVVGESPFPSGLVSTPASPASEVLDLTPGAGTIAAELTKVAESEYAPLFVNKAGTLTLYSQSQIRSQTKSIVSQATYGAGGLSIGQDIQLQYDGDAVRNIANVQMSGDAVYIDTNSTSVTAYGESEQYVESQVASYDDAVQIGDIVTGWGGVVYPKASPVDVVLDPNASWASTLGLELFERITLAVAPKTGNTITTKMLVSRISHSATPERWSTSLEGSARWAAVFIVGVSAIGGTDLLG